MAVYPDGSYCEYELINEHWSDIDLRKYSPNLLTAAGVYGKKVSVVEESNEVKELKSKLTALEKHNTVLLQTIKNLDSDTPVTYTENSSYTLADIESLQKRIHELENRLNKFESDQQCQFVHKFDPLPYVSKDLIYDHSQPTVNYPMDVSPKVTWSSKPELHTSGNIHQTDFTKTQTVSHFPHIKNTDPGDSAYVRSITGVNGQ